MKAKKSTSLLIANIISTIYMLIQFSVWFGIMGDSMDNGAAMLGVIMGIFMTAIPVLCTLIGTILGWFGYRNSSKGLVLAACILYTIGLLQIFNFMFTIPTVIFAWVGFSKVLKINKEKLVNPVVEEVEFVEQKA